MRYDSMGRHEGGAIENVCGAPCLSSISLRNLNRLLWPFRRKLFVKFGEQAIFTVSEGTFDDLDVPLRAVNRLLRPFGVLVSVLQPDDPKEDVWISLVRDRYPQKPMRA